MNKTWIKNNLLLKERRLRESLPVDERDDYAQWEIEHSMPVSVTDRKDKIYNKRNRKDLEDKIKLVCDILSFQGGENSTSILSDIYDIVEDIIDDDSNLSGSSLSTTYYDGGVETRDNSFVLLIGGDSFLNYEYLLSGSKKNYKSNMGDTLKDFLSITPLNKINLFITVDKSLNDVTDDITGDFPMNTLINTLYDFYSLPRKYNAYIAKGLKFIRSNRHITKDGRVIIDCGDFTQFETMSVDELVEKYTPVIITLLLITIRASIHAEYDY